jgi:hypothetical protein
MGKLFLFLFSIAVLSCNNDSKNSSATSSANADSASAKSYTWTDDDEKEFLADCVESAKAKVNDTLAFKHCNCVLKQLKQNFPSYDSANASADSAQLALYASKCQ